MDVFREDGHLTDETLTALVREGPLDGLQRLEAAEHLAFCDLCLQRYTDLLAGTELLVPEHSCQKTVWQRIRVRTIHLITSRYATAAAAVGLALTVVWGSAGGITLPKLPQLPERQYVVSDNLRRWGASLDGAMRGLNDILDGFGETRQGGDHSS